MRRLEIAANRTVTFVLPVLLATGCASGRFPDMTDDGLAKIARTPLDAVYKKPGFNPREFDALVVEECNVQFRDNWLRDQNRERGPSQLVTVEDMQRISLRLADACHDAFAARLDGLAAAKEESPGHTRILTVRPAVVNLDVLAPDIQASGRQTPFTTNAVRMDLRLELVDSETGEPVGRIVDHQRADEIGRARPASSVGNMADAERILRYWAAEVRALLE